MSDSTPQQEMTRRRRRGAELETAILEAAWDELVEVGFAELTMESVAARARTGVAVLYRRWTNKSELALATIGHYGETHAIASPDTGSLRGDMLALLTSFNDGRSDLIAVVSATFAGLHADSGLTPAQIRDKLLAGRPSQAVEVFRRAHDRGEIDLARIPPDVLRLPADILRHDLLMNLEPASPERIIAIVDEIFLPLVRR